MREDTNDLQSDDAAMNSSEFESSDMIEETQEHHHVHPIMSSEEFEAKLTDFFTKHKPTKLKFVSQIAFEFKGQEAFVLEHLHNKYVLGLVAEKPQKKVAQKPVEQGEHKKNSEPVAAEKPKSKKKLIVIIIIVVVLSGLGVTGFMMKDKLMAMVGMGHETENGAEKAKVVDTTIPVATPQKVETAPVEEVAPVKEDSTLEEAVDVLLTQ